MSLYYRYEKLWKVFWKYKDAFFEISNPLFENTISKLKLKADFLEIYNYFLKYSIYVGIGNEVWLIPFGIM